jgi:alkylated DNA repair dioxygenase AlkB
MDRSELETDLNAKTQELQVEYAPYFRPVQLDSMLWNRYGPQDSVSAHADDETILGSNPTVVSLSLGETRVFKVGLNKNEKKHKKKEQNKTKPNAFVLKDGDLLMMCGTTQKYRVHWIDKLKKTISASSPPPPPPLRYNVTLRPDRTGE